MTGTTPRGASPMDIDAALANPSAYFDQPQDVLAHPGMSQRFQLKLLQQWEHDARLLAEAEGEGMGGGEESMLGRVREALRTLEARMARATAGGTPAAAAGTADVEESLRRVALRTQEGVAECRKFVRANPVASTLFMAGLGFLIGRMAGGRH